MTKKQNQMSIQDGYKTTVIDLSTNVGSTAETPKLRYMLEVKNQKELEEFSITAMKEMGAQIIGKEDVLGKSCELWEMKNMGTKTWLWKMLPLKTETTMSGISIKSTAIKVEVDVSVPEDKFDLPEDVQIK